MAASDSIPVVLIGVTRHTALFAQNAFVGTSYRVAAVLDSTESPKPYQYSVANLGVVLHALHPRPRVLVTGTAVGGEMLEEIDGVWREYVEGALREEADRGKGKATCWVAVSASLERVR